MCVHFLYFSDSTNNNNNISERILLILIFDTFFAQVQDAAGLTDTVTVNISILDVNSQPQCPQTTSAGVTVRDVPGYVLTSVACTDSDFSLQFSTLTYGLPAASNSDGMAEINCLKYAISV